MGVIMDFFSWFSLSLKTSFAIFGIAEILFTFTGLSLIIYAVGLTIFFILLNVIGVDVAVKFEVMIVITLLIIMIIYIVTGLRIVEVTKFTNFAPKGIHSIFFTAGFVFVSFGVLLKVASLSLELHLSEDKANTGKVSQFVSGDPLLVLYLFNSWRNTMQHEFFSEQLELSIREHLLPKIKIKNYGELIRNGQKRKSKHKTKR